jgi:hypothetical protein
VLIYAEKNEQVSAVLVVKSENSYTKVIAINTIIRNFNHESYYRNWMDTIISIETDTCFSNPSYDVGVISVAFANPVTGIEHHLLRWERV